MAILMNGNDGEVTIGGTAQKVRSWTLNLEASEIETTNGTDASDAQSFLAGRKGGTWRTTNQSVLIGWRYGVARTTWNQILCKQGALWQFISIGTV